jgi:hypothetical protein
MEASVLDQIRLQEGRLFQSESIVALYLDAKAVINEMIAKDLSDINCEDAVEMLKVLSPKGIKDYHEKSLYECLKTVARLLWPGENLVIAKPKLILFFKGIFRRLTDKKVYISLDPIKQDFVIREAFRRTLVNDCLIIFEASLNTVEEGIEEQKTEDKPIKEDEIGPDDSASQVFYDERPPGARSVLDYKEDDVASQSQVELQIQESEDKLKIEFKTEDNSVVQLEDKSVAKSVVLPVARSVAPSVAKSVARSVAPSVAKSVARSVAPSVARSIKDQPIDDGRSVARSLLLKSFRDSETVDPLVTTAKSDDAKSYSSRSVVSNASLKKPLNVRRVVLEEEK